MKNSPWGKVQHEVKIRRGLTWVSTASHGGFLIGRVQQRTLSNAAISRGERWGSYLAYEEDCAASIVLYELPEAHQAICPETDLKNLFKSLSTWDADYLLERGLIPDPVGYARWKEMREEELLRREKSPDLIIAAWGDWADWVPKGTTGVETADQKRYLVDAESYRVRSGLNLLSKMTGVEPVNVEVL